MKREAKIKDGMAIHWQTVSISDLLQSYIKEFEARSGEQVASADWFLNQKKNQISYRLIIDRSK